MSDSGTKAGYIVFAVIFGGAILICILNDVYNDYRAKNTPYASFRGWKGENQIILPKLVNGRVYNVYTFEGQYVGDMIGSAEEAK